MILCKCYANNMQTIKAVLKSGFDICITEVQTICYVQIEYNFAILEARAEV